MKWYPAFEAWSLTQWYLEHASDRGGEERFSQLTAFRPVATFRHKEAVASSFLVV